MLYNDAVSTGERLYIPSAACEQAVCLTTNGGKKKIYRQSDDRIVPKKAGNAAGGKPRKSRSSRFCHTRSYCQGNIIHTQKWRK